jgi:hypothetical protein
LKQKQSVIIHSPLRQTQVVVTVYTHFPPSTTPPI